MLPTDDARPVLINLRNSDGDLMLYGVDLSYIKEPISSAVLDENRPSSTSEDHTCTVFPNPASDRMTVRGGDREIRTIRVTDAAGRLVFDTQEYRVEEGIDVKGLSTGLYFIQIVDVSGTTRTATFMKE
jgi:hypothetical protein